MAALLNAREVGELLSCSDRHVFKLSDAGKMPAPVRLGRAIRWSRAAIEEWIAGGCQPCRGVSEDPEEACDG